MVRRRAGGLDDKHVFSPDIFLNFDKRFPVRERTDRAFAQFHADGRRDALGQRDIGRAAKNFHSIWLCSENKNHLQANAEKLKLGNAEIISVFQPFRHFSIFRESGSNVAVM
jgi:hypothetical protein